MKLGNRVPIADLLKRAQFPAQWPYTPQDFIRQVYITRKST